jgi:hypothetical protein
MRQHRDQGCVFSEAYGTIFERLGLSSVREVRGFRRSRGCNLGGLLDYMHVSIVSDTEGQNLLRQTSMTL